MDKIYKVFVSSTFEDLKAERQEVLKALLALHCLPVGMELFSASNDDQWTHIKKEIEDCDYYILIIGCRYGSINIDDKSYTEMEYDYALKLGIPIISFLPYENVSAQNADEDPENRKRLDLFKNHVKKKLVKFWKNPDDLKYKVSQSMTNLIKENPAGGWIKNDCSDENLSYEKENDELNDKIYELNLEIERLNSKIDMLSAYSKRELEILLKNGELIPLSFSFAVIGDPDSHDSATVSRTMRFKFQWMEIFKLIAPVMRQRCAEDDIRTKLKSLIQPEKIRTHYFNNKSISDFYITHKSYNIIITKFKNLGLIALGKRQRKSTDHKIYWQLTPYGDDVLTQLLSV